MIFEDKDYDTILKNMLDKVPNTLDKREGSIIYDACFKITMYIWS